MSLSVAEVYLLLFRQSMVPIVGEAVPVPFNEQIELDGWSWNLKYDEDDGKAQPKVKAVSEKEKSRDDFKKRGGRVDDGVLKTIKAIQENARLDQADRNKKVLDNLRELKRAAEGEGDADDSGDDELTFKFEKNLDLASTQLMNCMKTGEVLPRAVLTLVHRAKNAPLTLVITFKKVVLTDYALQIDPSDTMTDIKETWTARFEEVDYVYQNRPGSGGIPGVTQGTARVFKMKLKSLF